jgi:hypothetical protein
MRIGWVVPLNLKACSMRGKKFAVHSRLQQSSEVTMRTITLVAIVTLLGTFAASAQGADCEKFCREKRCAKIQPTSMNFCMQKCVPNCQMVNQKKKGK